MYGTEVSPTLISAVTDAVSDEVRVWQACALDALYAIVYLDCIHVKVRDSGAVRTYRPAQASLLQGRVRNFV